MESSQHPKRPRLNSWGDASNHQQVAESPTHQYQQQHAVYSPHSHYPGNPPNMVWDGKNVSQPGQHAISNSRSQSVGGSSITPPPSGGHYATAHRTGSTGGHPLSHDISSPDTQGFSGYQQQPNPTLQSSEMDSQSGQSNGSPQIRSSNRQQLKPIQTMQPGVFHGQDSQGFFAAQPHQGASATADHRNMSVSGAELGSPGSSTTLAPGPGPMVANTGYPAMQTTPGAPIGGGMAASPVVPSPMSGGNGGGVMLGGGAQGLNAVVTTYPPRRKAIRAAQACDACRARKAKCDEGRPSCGFCKESQVPCVYREVPPPKQDRTLLQILDRLGRVETLLDKINTREEVQRTEDSKPQQQQQQVHQQQQLRETPSNAPASLHQNRGNNPAETPLEEDEQLTIPYQHTTAAHKLLWWPSIRKLIDENLLQQETYVIDEEENRGALRIYGRGEGQSRGDPQFEEDSDGENTGIGADQWGNISYNRDGGNQWDRAIGEENMEDQAMSETHGHEETRGSLSNGNGPAEPGKLKLDRQTVLELLNSYLANIHILHPILDTATITHTVFKFADRFNASQIGSPAAYSITQPGLGLGMSVSNDTASESSMPSPRSHRRNSISGKRKRSLSVTGSSIPHHLGGSSKPKTIPRTIHSVLVLLVLALGAVCLHKKPVPGPLQKATYQTPSYPTTSTPPYSANTPPFQNPQQTKRPARTQRNVDVIPGLAYFAQAMDIMGALAGSNELENVQAGLLAGLYWGQLARVLDSWKWISWACMGCQILIRMKLAHEKDELRKDLIIRAFWSCLQLESDVLAELDLPPSGISRLEDSMLLPSGISSSSTSPDTKEDDPLIWMYYLAQIALRKLLNRVHTALYKQDKTHLDSPRSLAIARELDYQLEQWKKHLPEPLRWDESDPPSSDINAARLRAKYFGARYIIHRPFVYHALHHGNENGFNGISTTSPPMASEMSQGSPEAGFGVRRVSAAGDDTSLEQSCRKCIEAALQSTTAFHAFSPDKNRPIITNVFGTAHAQFGNLLVLQAAYHSPVLRGMIVDHTLGTLFTKTIHWFQTLAPISPPLRRDATILENATSKLDFQLSQY